MRLDFENEINQYSEKIKFLENENKELKIINISNISHEKYLSYYDEISHSFFNLEKIIIEIDKLQRKYIGIFIFKQITSVVKKKGN